MSIQAEKKALTNWESYRKSIRNSTPLQTNETPEQKKKRIDDLEANPEEWKRYYFKKYFKYDSPAFHKKASKRLLKNFAKNKHWYEVRHWARGLSKSTTLMMDVLYLVLTGKLKNIILTSSTNEAATSFLEKYRAQLDANGRITQDYGKQELPGSWSEGNFTTRKGVKFLAVGARQTPRGNGNEEIRPDCIIVDDFDTDEDTQNGDTIDKRWDWFEKALFFTVDTSEPYLIVWLGNIIAPDCCVVRAGKMADHCETINIRDDNGKSMWPEKNSEADIDYQIKKVSWASSQQELFNNPIREGTIFKEITWGKVPPLSSFPFLIAYADPSTSNKNKNAAGKNKNSYKCIALLGCLEMKFYLITCYLDQTSNSKFVDWFYGIEDYVGKAPTTIYYFIENNTLQDPFYEQVFLPLFYEKGRECGHMIPVTPDTRPKPEKFFRIEGNLEPLARLGHLIFNIAEKDNPDMLRMEAQFKSVSPAAKIMDGPDAVEGGVWIIKNKMATTIPGAVRSFARQRNNKRF